MALTFDQRVLAFKVWRILTKFDNEGDTRWTTKGPVEVLEGLRPFEVGICHLGRLQFATDQEYMLLARHHGRLEERVLLRAHRARLHMPRSFLVDGYVWYAHSQPDDDTEESDHDRQTLREFRKSNDQEKSVLVTESGKCRSFTPTRDRSNWLPP
jgi:hypothetical protein